MFLEPQEVGDRGTLLMKMSLEAFRDGGLDLFSQISLTFFHNYFFLKNYTVSIHLKSNPLVNPVKL